MLISKGEYQSEQISSVFVPPLITEQLFSRNGFQINRARYFVLPYAYNNQRIHDRRAVYLSILYMFHCTDNYAFVLQYAKDLRIVIDGAIDSITHFFKL